MQRRERKKKLTSLLIAFGLTFAAYQPATALEVQPYGAYEVLFEHIGGYSQYPQYPSALQSAEDSKHNTGVPVHAKHFSAVQRMTIGARLIMNESLSATVDAIVGYFTWGGPTNGALAPQQNGGRFGTRAANIVSRQAFLDWLVPSTQVKVRMGLQALTTPTFATGTATPFTNYDFGTGIMVNAPITDNVGVTAGWVRASSKFRRGSAVPPTEHMSDTADYFVLTLPIKSDGFQLTPWGTVAVLGEDAEDFGTPLFSQGWKYYTPLIGAAQAGLTQTGHNVAVTPQNIGKVRGNSTAWWVGLGGELTMFDPFRFAFDAAWSGIDTKYSATDRSGWLLGLSAEYKTAWGVPTLKFWYTSGDDSNVKNGSERALMSSGSLDRTGSPLYLAADRLAGNMAWDVGGEAAGTWGVSLQWNKFSFIERLSHNVYVTYIQGTNSTKMAQYVPRGVMGCGLGQYLTTKDSLVELTLDSTYAIYKNLLAQLELSYLIENMDDDLWRAVDGSRARFSNAWRFDLKFMYMF